MSSSPEVVGESDDDFDVDSVIDDLENSFEIDFDSFVRDQANLDKLLAHGWRLTQDRDRAADLVQEAIARGFTELASKPRHVGKFIRYIQTAMANLCIDQSRRQATAQKAGNYGDSLTPDWHTDGSNADDEADIDLLIEGHRLSVNLRLPEDYAIAGEARAAIEAAIAHLTPSQQVVAQLTLGLHPEFPDITFSQSEIADLLQIPIDRVKPRWRYGLPTLRLNLETFWNDWKQS